MQIQRRIPATLLRHPCALQPSLQLPLEKSSSVEPQINQKRDRSNHAREKNGASRSRRGYQLAGRLPCMRMCLEQQQSNSSDNRRAGSVKNPLQHVNAEHVRTLAAFLCAQAEADAPARPPAQAERPPQILQASFRKSFQNRDGPRFF